MTAPMSHGKGTIVGLQNVCKGTVSSRPATWNPDAPRSLASVHIPLSAETIRWQIPQHCRSLDMEGRTVRTTARTANSGLQMTSSVHSHEMT